MNTTLDAVLHDALAQSERFHVGLAAPLVRSTIARKRVVRRAAVSSAATVGAVGIGVGAYAISTGFPPTVVPAGGTSASITPSSSPSPASSAWSNPAPSQNTPGDPASLSSLRGDFCQNLPLIVAWSEAQGITDPQFGITYSTPGQPSSFGCFAQNPDASDGMSSLEISFTFGASTGGDVPNEKCVDDKGTMTFEQNTPTAPSDAHTRTGTACRDDVLVVVIESLPSAGAFALTDAQIKVPAEASVAKAEQARFLAP